MARRHPTDRPEDRWHPDLREAGPLFWLEDNGKATQVPAAGPLVFAGEHLSDAWPGYMNGGAQTGRLAAQAVLGS